MSSQSGNDILAIDYDCEPERSRQRQAKLDEFNEGIRRIRPYSIDDEADFDVMALVKRFLAERAAECDRGHVSTFEYRSVWDTVIFLGSFNTWYYYLDATANGDDDQGLPAWEYFSNSESINENLGRDLREMLMGYLVSAAALARKAGSPTYDGWIALMMRLKFTRNGFDVVFTDKADGEQFVSRIIDLAHRLWADNEVYQAIAKSAAEQHPAAE